MRICRGDFVFIFLTCLIIHAESGAAGRASRQKRSIGQFGDMIRAVVRREALHYNNYGNHCGFQGGDLPVVDEVDRCCYVHDRCYIAADAGACASYWFGASFIRYTWSWDGQAVNCGEADDACRRAACFCDKAAAECFTRHPWNAAHKKNSIWDILA
ncbi:basic phospholipase A2 taipoxin alpha chain-like [Macrobrachium rosenbergii]|uniref:basic phospholipase A2 taipoxin alpha chain-like n=1 Tax=Macrobrachium rosenbergii TaxID=79674 RepID=UPI0034D54EDD